MIIVRTAQHIIPRENTNNTALKNQYSTVMISNQNRQKYEEQG